MRGPKEQTMNAYMYIHEEFINNALREYKCSSCAPGSRVFRHCNDESNTLCMPCSAGHYMDIFNNMTSCIQCDAPCATSMRLVDRTSCAPNHNIVCQCMDEYYMVANRFCTRHSKCKPGFGMKTPGNPEKDTSCENCHTGEFSAAFSKSEKCRKRTNCTEKGMVLAKPGSSTRNNNCDKILLTTTLGTVSTSAWSQNTTTTKNVIWDAERGDSFPWLLSTFLFGILAVMIVLTFLRIHKFSKCSFRFRRRRRNCERDLMTELTPTNQEQSADLTNITELPESMMSCLVDYDGVQVQDSISNVVVQRQTESNNCNADKVTYPTVGNVIPVISEPDLVMNRFRRDLEDLNEVNSELDFPTSITESSTFAYDRNVSQMRAKQELSPGFLHVVFQHIASGIGCEWKKLMYHLPNGRSVLNHDSQLPDNAFIALQSWAKQNPPQLSQLVEALYAVGKKGLAKEIHQLDPLALHLT